MKKYKIKIGYMFETEIYAENKKEAEEEALFEFDVNHPPETIEIKEIKK